MKICKLKTALFLLAALLGLALGYTPLRETLKCDLMEEDVCVITTSKTFTSDTLYESTQSIQFRRVNLSCSGRFGAYFPCQFYVHITGEGSIVVKESTLTFANIELTTSTGNVTIDSVSHISADGMIQQGIGFTGTTGGSFGGQGGSCTNPYVDSTYGRFDLVPTGKESSIDLDYQFGSQGTRRNSLSRGGGRVVVSGHAVYLYGNLTANGAPLTHDNPDSKSIDGGSGGYVYLASELEV